MNSIAQRALDRAREIPAGTRTRYHWPYQPRHGAGRQELRRRRSEVARIINSKPTGGGQHYPQSDHDRYGPAIKSCQWD